MNKHAHDARVPATSGVSVGDAAHVRDCAIHRKAMRTFERLGRRWNLGIAHVKFTATKTPQRCGEASISRGGRPATCRASCYEIEPDRWIHHPWDGCTPPTSVANATARSRVTSSSLIYLNPEPMARRVVPIHSSSPG